VYLVADWFVSELNNSKGCGWIFEIKFGNSCLDYVQQKGCLNIISDIAHILAIVIPQSTVSSDLR